MRLRSKTSIVLTTALTVTLVGCAPQTTPAEDGVITVVASTNVYGDIASRIGGDLIEVTSIIEDPAQDPHSFEADARVQLALSKADIVIENGGGYDPFVSQLLGSLIVPSQIVVNAVEISPLHLDGAENEHVWYHFPTMAAVTRELAEALTDLDPVNGEQYESNAAALLGDLNALGQRASALRSRLDGTGVLVTEPVPLYLLEAAGAHDLTPTDFSESIEEGSAVSAAVLNETLGLVAHGKARLLVYNEQTTSPATDALLDAADKAGVPVVAVTELLPEGSDYIGWMNSILDSVESAVNAP